MKNSQEVLITPAGAKVLRAMIVSCGTAGCFDSIKKLERVKTDVPLSTVGQDESGHWQMAAFSRLINFAVEEGIEKLDTYQVARYFGSPFHIEIMARIADHAGLGQYLGPHVGLVTHVLMPLKDGIYQNLDVSLDFQNHYLPLNPNDSGVPCYHLGVVANIPLSEKEVAEILTAQAGSEVFMAACRKIKGPVVPPEEYWQALTCTADKANS